MAKCHNASVSSYCFYDLAWMCNLGQALIIRPNALLHF